MFRRELLKYTELCVRCALSLGSREASFHWHFPRCCTEIKAVRRLTTVSLGEERPSILGTLISFCIVLHTVASQL